MGIASFQAVLALLQYRNFTAGQGGFGVMIKPFSTTYCVGGGAGGILIDGHGPRAGNSTVGGASGGVGYGAGGAAGGYNGTYLPGGAGAPGFVYVEWN